MTNSKKPSAFLGAHVSTAGGLHHAPGNGIHIGCEVIQIFTRNQRQWRSRPLEPEEADNFRSEFAKSRLHALVSHSSYLINLASPVESLLQQSRQSFCDELDRCERLGVDSLVFHPGSHLGSGEMLGLRRVAESINHALRRKRGYRTRVLLEITAGQGSNLGCSFEQLAEILERIEEQGRVGICLDSCHLFAAGYDLRTPKTYNATMRRLDEMIGIERIKAIHLNDCKAELGSHLDRHEHIGKGRLGKGAFRYLVNDERFVGVPMLLETPGGPEDYRRNLEVLKALRK